MSLWETGSNQMPGSLRDTGYGYEDTGFRCIFVIRRHFWHRGHLGNRGYLGLHWGPVLSVELVSV